MSPTTLWPVALHHYQLKSRQEWQAKLMRGWGDLSSKDESFFDRLNARAGDECSDAVPLGHLVMREISRQRLEWAQRQQRLERQRREQRECQQL